MKYKAIEMMILNDIISIKRKKKKQSSTSQKVETELCQVIEKGKQKWITKTLTELST